MTFTEPSSVFNDLSIDRRTSDTSVVARDKNGLVLEIRNFQNAGWSLEVRYDQADKGIARQIFTGRQKRCAKERLHCNVTDGRAEINTETGETAVVILKDGSFSLRRKGIEYFKSSDAPFRSHREGIDVSEGIMSRKITHFESGHFPMLGATYNTRMSRFLYPRPSGPVLGLPGQSGELNRNGYKFELYNTDDATHTPARAPLYQAWPLLLHKDSTGGWTCVFHDNPSRTFVDVGDFYSEAVTFESITGNTRVYVFHSEDIPGISQALSALLGHAVFPPAWAFGYQQCRWSYTSTKEVEQVAARFREDNIPCDAMYFDIHYMDGYRVFTRDPNNFENLRGCLDNLHAKGFHAVGIVDPGVKIDENFSLYQNLMAAGAYLKDGEGKPFQVRVWPGQCVLPDFSDPKAQEIWSDTQRDWLVEYGFDGIWNDMNEPANFDGRNGSTSNAYASGDSVRNDWNLFGYRMAQTSALGWKKYKPKSRSVIISRSGYAGVQQFAVNWQGDNHAWWEHLRLAIDTTVSYSIFGSLYTGADLPGFCGNPSDDLAVRFFQVGAFLPLFRGHSIFFARDKEPYAFAPAIAEKIRAAIDLRYSLMREWYSGFERAVREGKPTHVPVVTAQGNVARDQFLLFGKFLVAPIVQRDTEQREIFLPAGRWYPIGNTAEAIDGGKWISVPVTLDSIPVYVREGSVVVRNTVASNVAETLGGVERYEVYPDANGNADGYWYNDDLESLEPANAEHVTLRYDASDRQVKRG